MGKISPQKVIDRQVKASDGRKFSPHLNEGEKR